jgi:DeoR/GlpR family transcriptional regulator of sugar metabolism
MIYLPLYIPPELNITIITNSIGFLYETSKITNNHWILICLHGMVRSRNLSIYGYDTLKSAELYYPNKIFISCTGISVANRIADSSPYEVDIKRMMIERAQKVFLLADHTKLGESGQIFLCDFSSVENLITDKIPEMPEKDLSFLDKMNVIIAES